MQPISELFAADPPLAAYDVVVPCYNRAHSVADAVESVLAQDPAPARVIIVDDGSSDDSAAVIAALERQYPDRVEAVLLPRNGGASNARNAGAARARSDWIAFLDSDDLWLPGAARALLSAAASTTTDIVVGHFARVEADGIAQAPECHWDGGCIRTALASGGVIGPSWAIVRRTAVFAVNGFDPSFRNCNDWDFYTRVAAAGGRFTRIEAVVALYRTVAGDRLVNDSAAGAINAQRVLAHPYFADA
ncbi:glycosyltransferase family A protein [Sphingomonas sp. Y38-1Y]|uniref:glycosyltransferase family 2 protein n=1 Tax=Sphingomonas sp. Y38-1Y TaxID=3078265 RepID=UPI0028E2DAD8|nr:glycosyltransferase family A protein [Sphingomonas sp. Y38-1Y]